MSLLRRTLTGAFATALAATALTVAAPPAAAFSDDCPFEGSTRLLTAEDRSIRLWVYEQASQWDPVTYVCFKVDDEVGGSLHIHGTGLAGDPPSVTPDLSYQGCPDYIDVEDPVRVVVKVGGICVGFGDDIGIALSVALPQVGLGEVHLLLDGGTLVADAVCTAAPSLCSTGYPYVEVL